MLNTLKPRIKTLDTRKAKASPATERIRGGRLQTIRKRILRRDNYLCQMCLEQGNSRLAEEVDHKTPLFQGGAESDENRWSLCKSCHDAKSAEEEAERRG